MQKPAMFFKIIAVFLKNMAGFYVVHKGVSSEIPLCRGSDMP